jgi:hypothetical protein
MQTTECSNYFPLDRVVETLSLNGMLGAREMLRLASRSEMTNRIISANLVTDQNCRHDRRQQAPAQWLKSQDFNSNQLGSINAPLFFSWRSIDHLPEVSQAVLHETGRRFENLTRLAS